MNKDFDFAEYKRCGENYFIIKCNNEIKIKNVDNMTSVEDLKYENFEDIYDFLKIKKPVIGVQTNNPINTTMAAQSPLAKY